MADSRPARVSRRRFLAAACVGGSLAAGGCVENPRVQGRNGRGGTETGELSGQIRIAGSSTVFPLAVQMRKAFQREHPAVDISVKSTGTGGGFANHFCPGDVAFNNASRPIGEGETAQCAAAGVEPIELKVATDAVTVVVNDAADWFADDCIAVDALAEIWSPETRPSRWSDVDPAWPDREIKLFGPTDASGTFDYFTGAILGEEGRSRTDYQATEQDNTILTGVEKNEYAMGYLGFAYYRGNRDAAKALAVDDGDGCTAPSLDTAKSGAYAPLSRPLFTYVAKSALAADHVAAFAEFWVEHSTSREIVTDAVGYVPNAEDERAAEMRRLRRAIDDAREGQ